MKVENIIIVLQMQQLFMNNWLKRTEESTSMEYQ